MRHFIIALLVATTSALSAQMVTFSPQIGDFETEITLVFNLNLSKGPQSQALLGATEDIYLWAGASDDPSAPFKWSGKNQSSFNAPIPAGRMTRMGNNRWRITLTPRTYFGVPEGKTIAVLGLLLKNAAGSAQTEDVVLTPVVETTLTEVVIQVRKPRIEQMADRTVLNVDADVNAAGSTLFEVLQKAPGLAVTGDEQLMMNGKSGLNVYIDGRPSQLSGRDLSNYLQSLPAGSVEKVEIYSNPPARFDAQGNAGIINIKLKKGLNDGLNGALYGSYTQNIHYRMQGGGNFNLRKNKLLLFAQYNAQRSYQHTDGWINRRVGDQLFQNNTTDQDYSPLQHGLRTGFDWQLSKKSTFGVMLNGRDNRTRLLTPGSTYISENGQPDQVLLTQNDRKFRQTFANPNLNFRYENGEQFTFNADADWMRFNNTNDNQIESRFFQPNWEENYYERIENDLNTNIDVVSVRSDLSWNLKSAKARVESGAKVSSSRTQNDLFAFKSLNNSTLVPDTNRTNSFMYTESVYAAYGNISQRPNDRWEWQIGLRTEYTDADGLSTDLRGSRIERPDTSYLNWFPSAFVQFTPHSKHGFKLAYTRRIGRPSYQDLNPFEQILDAFTSEIGNSYLRPAFTHNVEITYMYHSAASLSLGANRTQDPLQWLVIQPDERAYATTVNIGTQDNLYANLNLPLPVNKWWEMYTYFGVYYNHYRAQLPDGAFNGGRLGANLYMNHNFNLGRRWKAQVDGWWNAPTRELVYQNRGLGSINIGLKKSLLNDQLQLSVNLNDLLNTQRWQQSANFGNQNFELRRKWESRGVRLSVNWKWGNQKIKTARDRKSGASDEQGRIKQ
jgi:iron complex outermembrane recepter protein